MRSLGTRRVAQAAGAAMVAVLAVAGCSAGQVAETAMLKAPVAGLNTESPEGDLLIRNLQVIYNNPTGYAPNTTAPIELSLFNQTEQPMTVVISSTPQQDVTEGVVSAQQVGVGAAPTGASSAPAAATPEPAKFTIAPLSSQRFLPGDSPALLAVGLSNKLVPGSALRLTIQVDNEAPLEVLAPFGIPASPASRAPGIENENHEE
jgi:hypothetical protein